MKLWGWPLGRAVDALLRGVWLLVVSVLAAAVAIAPRDAAATPFTMTTPNGIALPTAYPEAGGVVMVMVGVNGNVYYQFSDPTGAFVGFNNNATPAAFQGNPFTINNPIALNCGNSTCATYFGGAIATMYIRFSANDGDTSPGDFDANDITLVMNGFTVGNWTSVTTQATNTAGTVASATVQGFGNNTFNTGWFTTTDAALLSNILTTGQTTTQVQDRDPNDNFWDFRIGNSLANPLLRTVAPGYDLTKTPSTTTYTAVGQVVSYTYVVRNIGSVRISNLAISDDRLTGITCDKTVILATSLGATPDRATCTGTYTIRQADIDAGRVTNIARATGTPEFGVLGTLSATATVTGPAAAPALQLTKATAASNFGNAGTQVPYTFALRNGGNVTLTNVVVTDPLLPGLSCNVASLAPGGTFNCAGAYTVRQANVDAWTTSGTRLSNTASATARAPSGAPVSTTSAVSIPGPVANPTLAVDKTSPSASFSAVGQILNFAIRVTNTGNVTFPSAPAISDPLVTNAGGTVSCPAGPVAPGASITCSASYTVTQADLDARSITNRATASITVGGQPRSAADDVVIPAVVTPGLAITKRLAAASPATFDAPGVALTYEYVLRNTGNISVATVSVSDDRVAVTCPAGALAPGATATCTSAPYLTTQADIDAGGVTNTATGRAIPQGSSTPVTSATPAVLTVPSVRSPALAIDKTAPAVPSSSFAPGLVVTYSYAVRNTGNVTLTDQIRVTDDRIGAPFACGSPPYAINTTVTCTAAYTVTAADVTAGLVQNTASASDGTTVSNTDTATIPQAGTPALTLAKTAAPTTFDSLSDSIVYTFRVTNSGQTNIVTPGQPITITDPKLPSITCSQPAVLAPGASYTCTGTYSAITQAELDAGEIVNTATAAFTFNTPGGPVTITSPSAGATVTSDAEPSLTLDKTGPADFTSVGQSLTYSFLITNTGAQTLATVTVTDPLIPGLSCTRTAIAPNGGTASCSGTYSVTQADIDAEEIVNTARATASTAAGGSATAEDSLTLPLATGAGTRSLTVAKTVAPVAFSRVGDTLVFTIGVTNTGTQTLTAIAVTDALVPAYSCTIATLAPGASDTSCQLSYRVTQADIDRGSVQNTAGAATAGAAPAAGSATATGPAAAPGLDLTKTALGGYSAVGDTVTFRMTVRNSGNVTVSGVTVTDSFFDPDLTCTLGTLAPGAIDTSCTGTITVTQADIDRGTITNTASVTGTPAGGGSTGDSATATAFGPPEVLRMVVSKTEAAGGVAGPNAFGAVGSTETYTFSVANTGSVTLRALTLSDPLTGFTCSLDDIPPGATATTCSGGAPLSTTYTITQADIDRGSLTNTVAVTGASVRGTAVSGSDSVTLGGPPQTPALALDKTSTGGAGFDAPGDVIAYSYVVTNTGNLTLTAPITISDNRTLVTCPSLPAGGLAPGGTLTCTATDSVDQADIDAGSVTNTATARISQPVTGSATPVVATATDSATVAAAQAPAMTLDKRLLAGTPTTFNAVGDTLTYQFVITNAGNTTLAGPIQVDDPLLGGTRPCLTGTLAPGASRSCQIPYTITQADLDAGAVVNSATAFTGPAGSPTLQSGLDGITVPALQSPALDFDKSTTQSAPADFFAGNTITYTYLLTNTGNVTLPGPFAVTDTYTTPTCPAGPLAPGAQLSCTGTHVITATDIALGTLTNNARPVTTFNGQPVPATPDSVTIPTGADPALTVVKSEISGVPLTAAGQVLAYEYIVINTGNAPFADDVEVFDDRIPGAILCFDSNGGTETFNTAISGVDPFAVTCTASYTVTQADMDRGFVTNNAYAQSTFAPASSTPIEVQSPSSAATVSVAASPGLSVAKAVTAGPDPADAGDTLSYAITTTNSGNQTISGLTVTDPRIPALSCTIAGAPAAQPATLAPGDDLVCAGSYTVTQADVDAQSLTNTATAEGSDPAGQPVTASGGTSHPLVAPDASLDVAKTLLSPTATPAYAAPGDQLTFGVRVENTGQVTLTGVTVTDSLVAGSCSLGPLAPGAADDTCRFVYTVTQDDIDAGRVSNTVTALSQPANPGATPFSSGDTLVTDGPPAAPAFSVAKTADRTEITAAGQIVTYSYRLTNIGNVTIRTEPEVSDDRIGSIACPGAPIAPGGGVTCSAPYTVTQADIDAGGVTNIATASAPGVPASAPAELRIPSRLSPGLDITKVVRSGGEAVGDTVIFDMRVLNTGNTSLVPTILTDTLLRADGTPVALTSGPAYLSGDAGVTGQIEPQETWVYTATATVTQDDIDAGGLTNSFALTAAASDGTSVSDVSDDGDDSDGNTTDDVTEFAITGSPAVTVAKSILDGPERLFPNVWSVRFAIDVTNSGNRTLTAFQLTDDLAAFLAPATILSPQYPLDLSLSGLANATANAGYDGVAATGLLAPGALIAPGETGRIEIAFVYQTGTGYPAGPNVATASSPVLPGPVSGSVGITGGDRDGDGIPDDVETCSSDRDGDGICDADDYDPTGYFYCQEDGRILPGGSITVIGPAGAQSGIGTSNNITILRDGSDGSYQFFVTAPGRYTLVPGYPGFGDPSTTRVPTSVPLDVTGLGADPAVLGSSEAGSTGALADFSEAANTPSFLVFDIEAGDPTIVSNNLALEACLTDNPISATKTASTGTARIGDPVTFTLTFTNGTTTGLTDLSLVDVLPAGLVYVAGSATLNGTATEPAIAGRRLSWPAALAPGASATVTLTVRVTSRAQGRLENRAWIEAAGGDVISSIGRAVIRVEPEHVFDCSDVIGKVFDDRNMNGYQDGPEDYGLPEILSDDYVDGGKFGTFDRAAEPEPDAPARAVTEGEPGLPGVRLVTTRGQIITTDEHGRWHLPCAELPADIGTNFTVKLDTRSLPTGYRVTTENPRTIRLTAGKMARMNFGAAIATVVDVDLTAAAFAPGTATPSAALADGIRALVEQMRDTPSVIRLGYLQGDEDRATVRRRLDAVEDLLRAAWRDRGRYKLTLERTIRRLQ